MIGLDTNILARYYVEDRSDVEAMRQREAAKKLIASGKPLMVCKTVILELEWVLRGYYEFSRREVMSVMRHLLALPQVQFEDKETLLLALSLCDAGLELADALHHASYRQCSGMASFDYRKFAKRAVRLGLSPRVTVPK